MTITKEEAIQILSTRDAHGVLCGYTSGVTEALDMAIEALSKPMFQQCTELISKKEAINELDEFIKPFVELVGDMGAAINGAKEVIKDVPPVEAIPCEVADKIGEENERLKDTIGQLEEQIQQMEARIIIARMEKQNE